MRQYQEVIRMTFGLFNLTEYNVFEFQFKNLYKLLRLKYLNFNFISVYYYEHLAWNITSALFYD